ncbi:MAG: ROK family protein, partial [Alistipes sp.]|nr:ROK family protein [Alistipes sp.]
FIMITLGTGVGSGFVSNGEMIYGHDGFAGEFGHVVVDRGGRQCGCGRKGCLEAYTSANGIKRTAFELMATMTEPSPLREYSFDQLDSAMLSQFAAKGDPIAKECFRVTGQKLGYALADAVTITSPEAIFIFGGLAKAGNLIFDPIKWYMEENMLVTFKNKVKVLPSELQNKNAAILGAAALVWQAK